MSALRIYLLVYGALALGHLLLQMCLAMIDARRQRRYQRPGPEWTPAVTVIVPVFNEDLNVLRDCLRSIDAVDYPRIEAIVVDDRSKDRVLLVNVLEEFMGGRIRVVLQPDNRGKRLSQRAVLDQARGEIIVTIDSDTTISKDGIRNLVSHFQDPAVGAVTGDVQVRNKRTNLLTRLIAYRYWNAFHQERAAQNVFRTVMCCSGPFSAYRRSVIDGVKDDYVSQRFLGQECTFGDDRHLTNLVLRAKYDVLFDAGAISYTEVPTTVPQYVRQQVRWNKSFYREMVWSLRNIRRPHPYLLLDLILQGLLPFLLVIALVLTAEQGVADGPLVVAKYLAVLMGIAVVRASYGVYRTRDPGFLLFVVYGFLHVLVLLPVRFYALATLRRTHWGTRGSTSTPAAVPDPVTAG
jgi:cellulose synthase/poly-beta-1,6-N-acetylglucosamine synthase-like glycosyltransferase